MSLQITIEEKIPRVFVVTAIGSIDATSHEDFKTQVDGILHKGPKAIIFDLAGVDFINSSGLGVVLMAKVTLEKSGAEFGLNKLQPQIKAAFEIIKALPKQNVFASVEEMDNYLAQIQMQVKEKELP
jgi:anti-anti-sigma factor